MTGADLWKIFLAASVPASELKALGEDMGYLRATPSAPGGATLLKIAYVMSKHGVKISSDRIFTALKSEMPGIFSRKGLLYGIADAYEAKTPYQSLRPDIRGYFDAVGEKLPPVTTVPAPPAVAVKRSVSTAPPAAPAPKPGAPETARGTFDPDPPPAGLSKNQYEFVKAVAKRLQDPNVRDRVAVSDIASARNLAERGKLATATAAFDSEIARRGEGAQGPVTDEKPKRAGMGPGITVLALFFFLFAITRS